MSNTAEQDPHAGEERTTRKPDNAQFVVCAAVFAVAILRGSKGIAAGTCCTCLETVKPLADRGVSLLSLTDGIDSSTAPGRTMIGVLGSPAEYERELTRERTALKRAPSRSSSQPAMITR